MIFLTLIYREAYDSNAATFYSNSLSGEQGSSFNICMLHKIARKMYDFHTSLLGGMVEKVPLLQMASPA